MVHDPVSQKFFNQQNITLEIGHSIDGDEFDVFNNLEMLARLTGSPDGSHILVSRGSGTEDSFNLLVKNEVFKYPSEYFIVNRGEDLSFALDVDSIYVREEFQDQGIGVRSVILSIREAKKLGFHSVTLYAAGSAANRQMFFGYHVWPSLGFDAPLPGQVLRELPLELQNCSHLSDLMRAEAGPEWWYTHGVGLDLAFELRDDSISWQLLNEYEKAKGIFL